MDCAWREDETLPPQYRVQSSNISESTSAMFERERNENWLEAIDGILKKISLRFQTSHEKYGGRTGVVERVYAEVLDCGSNVSDTGSWTPGEMVKCIASIGSLKGTKLHA
ncbi:hypothetical protein IV203_033653 [Nitzschia inconspicua]|uniref:Uncharacterized protein n=1 Tax=Nitzschia inconspicua TaxID=303405 RepID=A0A9K3Q9A0_9STRA|nr:hypothetical protein IV203_033653 [Nitzschia inconspicua]